MKTFILFCLLTFAFTAHAQVFITEDTEYGIPDSLTVKKILHYRVLDSNTVRSLVPKQSTVETPTVINYREDATYYAAFKYSNNWLSLLLESEGSTTLVDAQPMEAAPHLWLLKLHEESYGSGGGTGRVWCVVLATDGVPRQLMALTYGCWEEMFGTVEAPQSGYTNEYERPIAIGINGITFGDINKAALPENCELTNLPTGTYVLKNGRIVRQE